MAYTEQATNYLIPTQGIFVDADTVVKTVTQEIDIGATGADHGEMLCVKPCTVYRLQFTLVSEASSGTTTAPTVLFKKRPTPASATGETTMGTLVILSGAAIGTTTFLDITPTKLAVGDAVEISHTVGVGTPTGKGFWSMLASDSPEDNRNNSELTATTVV